MLTICTPTPYAEYDPADEDALRADLERLTRYTLVEEVLRPDALRLTPSGRTADGFVYTMTGLKQVLSWACPGAYDAVYDIATGSSKRGVEPAPREAIALFNRFIDLRFDRFDGRVQVLKNLDDKTIDGLLGPGYIHFENLSLLERAREAAESLGRVRFLSAVLVGRRLAVRFRLAHPLGDVTFGTGVERIYQGVHFANSEVGGEASARVAAILIRSTNDGVLMAPYLGGRIAHTGRRFSARMAQACARVSTVDFGVKEIDRRAASLFGIDLGLAVDDGKHHARSALLTSILHDHGLPKSSAAKVVRLTAYYGGIWPEELLFSKLEPSRAARAARSAGDLLLALTEFGRRSRSAMREAAERAAYDLLFGRLRLKF